MRARPAAQKKRRGRGPAVRTSAPNEDQRKRLRTLRSLCEAIDRAVEDNCCRVCNESRLAPSSLVSASTRLSAPVLSVLIVALVKSWRICTIDRLAPKVDACARNVLSDELTLAMASLMSLSVWNVLVDAASPIPVAEKVT